MPLRRSLTALLLTVLVAAPGGARQQAPVFRTSVDLVTVDATVVDSQGRPIGGLSSEQFSLKVDGQPRRIVAVQFISRQAAPAESTPGTAAASRASSNQAVTDGRLVLIAVDRTNIRRLEGRSALRAAERFVDALGPSDRVAVMGVSDSGEIEFSRDRPRAKRQLATLTGEAVPALIQPTFNLGLTEALWIADGNKSRLEVAVRRECGISLARATEPARSVGDENTTRNPCPSQLEQEARMTAQQVRTEASLSLSALMALIGRLKTIDGPKTVAWLSEGLIAEPRLVDLTPLGAAAQEARVSVYVLQIEAPIIDVTSQQPSPTLTEDAQLRSDGLARLAGAAGGALFRIAGSDPTPFNRILSESSGYYLLAFEATETDRDGRPHKIDVSVQQSGATLRSREAFRFESTSSARRWTETRLVELLRAPAVAAELPLRAAAYAFYEPGSGKVRLEIGAETDPDEGLAPQVLFGYVLLDRKGVVAASLAQETSSRRFTAVARVDPGVYTLKVAGIDRYGRSGSLPRSVLAGMSDAALPTSELMVARATADPNAPLDPIIDRTADDRILVYLELYPDAGRSLRDVDVTIAVRSIQRREIVLTMPAAISTRSDRHGVVRVVVPTQRLEPGRYVLRADVTDGGKSVAFAERLVTIER
ncbi:MAG TPA: VWA domain-containing protein [Vicinamibacterales bacterium]|nr:VWA domain-containing protein [Vicinamibacterales bacterium]